MNISKFTKSYILEKRHVKNVFVHVDFIQKYDKSTNSEEKNNKNYRQVL